METQKIITYEEFGAIGDGINDDISAIAAAHAYANDHHLPVRAKDGARYYIGKQAFTAIVKTNTDWGTAEFIIDDRETEDPHVPVFSVESYQENIMLDIRSLKKNQKKLEVKLPCRCFINIQNSQARKYYREGLNVDNGTEQTDCFVADADGNIKNMIIWDFDQLTSCIAHPIDEETLILNGGIFTTIANHAERVYNYYGRNITIHRSNTKVSNLTHYNTEEGESGSPYRGFLNITSCAFVTVSDCFFTGHRIYSTIGRAGLPVSMGTYDINVFRSSDISFVRCRQDNIMDRTRWGIMGTSFCKNLSLDNCIFSRFDAHMGVTNCTIRNSRLGWQCLNLIGHGTFILENTEAFGRSLINLRDDYGSTWDGTVAIHNCTWHPVNEDSSVFSASYSGNHDFGYPCYMPVEVTIDGLTITDNNLAANPEYHGLSIFSNYDAKINEADDGTKRPYPYHTTRKLCVRGIRTESGKGLFIKKNPYSMPELRYVEFMSEN